MDKSDERLEGMVERIRKDGGREADGRRGGGLLLPSDLAGLSHGNVSPNGLGSLRPAQLVPLPCGASLAIDSQGRIVGVGTPSTGTRVSRTRTDLLYIAYAVQTLGRVSCAIAKRLASMGQAVG
jgi:hypothetical protein